MKKLFLLDAYALIYRAHFAFIRAPRITSTGMNTSAIFGFTTTLLDVLKNEQPTHIGIVYDTHVPTFRHIEYKEYKANRQETPEDIRIAVPYIHKMAEAFGIPNLHLDGWEADDVIGTLAKKACREGYHVYMMTPDKDFGQIVEPCVYQYRPAIGGNPAEILGPEEVCQKWGIERPEQVIDILGLMGDAVDNIPGVPGVGEKTASKLVKEWGSVENLLANADKITGKLGEKLREHKEDAILSKRLATIEQNVPIDFDEDKLLMEAPDLDKLRDIFEELEFRTLGKRVFGDVGGTAAPAPPKARKKREVAPDLFTILDRDKEPETPFSELLSFDGEKVQYHLVQSEEDRLKLAERLHTHKHVAFDTETSSLDNTECDLVGFSFAVKPGEAWYIPVPADREEAEKVLKPFRAILENKEIEKIGQNLKFDIVVMKRYGVEVAGPLFDTLLAHYLYEPEQRHGMDRLAEKFLQYTPISIDQLIGKGRKQKSMADLDPSEITDYACEDADVVLQLKEKLNPLLDEVGARKLYEEVEAPLVYVLSDVELEGVRIDEEALKAYSKQLLEEMTEIEIKIYELAGEHFNISSPAQLGDILFDKLKLDPNAKRTPKSKQYSTGEEVLSALAPKHPIAQKILDYRQLQKLKSTYVDALPKMVNPYTGRVHSTFNQTVAATGRLSSTDPNLQNIPIRTDRGKEIRKAFIPRNEKYVLLSADYSQIELRLVAEMSHEESMIDAFKHGLDIHAATAAKVFGVDVKDVTGEQRRRAKMVNFGIIYGISAFGLAQRLGIPRSEAAELIRSYNEQYPRISEYMQSQIAFARKHGYVETLLGRRRYLREINSANQTERGFAERNAINAPIQGSAADMIKVAMVNIHEAFKKKKFESVMILQVHDELVFDVLREELDEVKKVVRKEMQTALPGLKIPIEVEMGTGENWLEAH